MPDADPPFEILITFIKDTFDLDELSDLCLKLGVDFQDLPGGDRLGAKARELVLFLKRRDRLPDLMQELARERPERYKNVFGPNNKNLDDLFRSAIGFQLEGELGESLQLLRRVKEADPHYPRIDVAIASVEKELRKPHVDWLGRVIPDKVLAPIEYESNLGNISNLPRPSARRSSEARHFPIWGLAAILLIFGLVSLTLLKGGLGNWTLGGPGGESTPTPTLTPTPTVTPHPTPAPTLMPVQSWTNETEFSIAQGWDQLLDEKGETGFENGEFFVANKKNNILYISLWKAVGGIINDAAFAVDLVRPGNVAAPDAAGVVFGWQSNSQGNTYAFLVDKNGKCKFLEESYNSWSTISQGQINNFLIQKEFHTVTVVIKDGHAYGFVDGNYCDEHQLPAYDPGYIGVAALSGHDQTDGTKAYFDNARFFNLP